MNKTVKRLGVGLGTLVVLLVGVVGAVFVLGGARLNGTLEVERHALSIPVDSASVANGGRLTTAYGCRDCHGEDLGGSVFIDEPAFAVLAGPNLTDGEGGVGNAYDPDSWERAIRHGVGADGRTLVIMPSSSYAGLADRDIGEIVAFLQTLPSVDRALDPPRFGPMARFAAVMAGAELVPATAIDHDEPHPAAVPRTISVEFGTYLAGGCKSCHGADFSGGPPAMGLDVAAANLTPHPETGLGTWSLEDFDRAVRSGRRPDGSGLSLDMPWAALSAMTDTEVEALWMYLQSLPPVEADRRSE